MSDDLVKRLYDRRVCSPAQNSCRNDLVLDQAADRIEELETKLAKAVEALEGVQTFVKALAPFTHPDHTLEPTLGKALTILAELKGQNDG